MYSRVIFATNDDFMEEKKQKPGHFREIEIVARKFVKPQRNLQYYLQTVLGDPKQISRFFVKYYDRS